MKEIIACIVGVVCIACMLSILRNEIRPNKNKEVRTLKKRKKAKRPAPRGPAYPQKNKENHEVIYFDGHRYRRD